MMDFLTDLAAKRRKFLEGLDANQGDINLDIFEDFYPDQAHFVYELLQNAEDAGATEASFELSAEGCLFTHDGTRVFTEDDVRGITGIHNSTKTGAADQIGKFGVGFKSVFVYCLTPEIHSGQFHFKISRLVLPEPLDASSSTGDETRFWLPFNNPKKAPETAFAEVRAGLQDLAETSLIFLRNLNTISWKVEGGERGAIVRETHSDHHIEVLKETGGKTTASSHFLKFDQPVEGLPKQRVAIAFALDFLPNVSSFAASRSLKKQLRIVETKGKVAVYFPAEKEASNLRFHVHAPFVPELSRASIKETAANAPLFEQLGQLAATALPIIRDLGLLTTDFLGGLPNPHDQVPDRYKAIETSIVAAMREEPLTPTHAKGHAPAKRLLQAKLNLKELLSEDDLEYLVEYESDPPLWSVAATQRSSTVDRFLEALSIRAWGAEEFVTALEENLSSTYRYVGHTFVSGPDEDFQAWLASKSVEWHQALYALLYNELDPDDDLDRLSDLRLVRLRNGEYSKGSKCFFVDEHTGGEDVFLRVDPAVYTSGKSKKQQQNARRLLEAVGVKVVGEKEQIEAILEERYSEEAEIPDKKTHLRDLKRFIALVETTPTTASLFRDYWIFERADELWAKPTGVFLDSPYQDTGLRAYYDASAREDNPVALAERYSSCGISRKRLIAFALAVGVKTSLEVTQVRCRGNSAWGYLSQVAGERNTSPIDRDYVIRDLDTMFETPNVELSRLIWRTMCGMPQDERYLIAIYRRNASSGSRKAPSRLVHQLKEAAWIPQKDGRFVKPADASSNLLPEGFAFDPGWQWLKSIEFGKSAALRSEELRQKEQAAKDLGFIDELALERARRFVALPPESQEEILAAHAERKDVELPDSLSRNPERRASKVGELATTAPERITETRSRSVSIGRDAVKDEARQYLTQQYTSDGDIICQACKKPVPFKLNDGTPYFERVEFLSHLKKHHHQNYLALCPNHAAMFAYANGSKDELEELLETLDSNEMKVVMAKKPTSIYFTKNHIADLKKIIEVEQSAEAEDGGELAAE